MTDNHHIHRRVFTCAYATGAGKQFSWLKPVPSKRRSLAHKRLDEAVFATYGWKPDLSDEEILEKLLALNLERAKQG